MGNANNSGKITEIDVPVPLKIRGGHGAPVLGFNTLYAKGDFGGGILRIYGSPDGTFQDSFPFGGVELSGDGCVAFLGRADTFWLRLEGASVEPDLEFWVL